jgi:hypothetical protein
LRLRVAVFVALLPACSAPEQSSRGDSDTTRALSSAVVSIASEADTSCEFVRVKAHPSADSLIAEFLRRDAVGQFLQTDSWFAGAVECPGHEPGPDAYTVIADFRTRDLDRTAASLAVEVTSRRLGFVEASGGFRADSGQPVDTVRAIRTEYGWRVAAPSLRQFVSESVARARGDLSKKGTTTQ